MSNDIGFSPISVAIKANKLSKSKFHEMMPSQEVAERCRKVFEYEKNDLSLDRSNQAIGLPPSFLHAHELISYSSQLAQPKNSYALSILESQANSVEMIFTLMKPSVITIFTNQVHAWSYDYLNSFGFTKVYVPNDENLFRLENILEMQECPFQVLNKEALLNGEVPADTDVLYADAVELASYVDVNILRNLFTNMKSGSVVLLTNINDFFSYYANNEEFDENKMDHPLFDIIETIRTLDNCYVYHIGTTSGFCVIIKK